jgi:hypothetical protein
MTNRFFRNAVGVAALTSLALGLACSGSSDPDPAAPAAGKPATPIVSISGLNSNNQAITKHQYVISVSDPSGQATSFTATGSLGATLTPISGASAFVYIPQKSGDERISVYSVAGSNKSDAGMVTASVVENRQPSVSGAANVPPGGTTNISLQSVDGDGDLVTWAVTATDGLTATLKSDGSGPLTITVPENATVGNTHTIKLTSTEKSPTGGYIVDNTQVHSLVVTVSTSGGGSGELFDWHQGDTRGQVHAFPNNLDEAALGVPFTFQFNAGDPYVPANRVTGWHVNGGLSPFNADGENAAPPESWIGQPQQAGLTYMRPAIGSLGDAFERWRLGIDYQKNGQSNNRLDNFPGGRLYFVPQDTDTYTYHPDTYSSRTLFGVRADFNNDNVLAYQDFYIKVTENSEPELPYGTYNNNPLTITVLNKRNGIDPRADDNVPAAVPWIGKYNGTNIIAESDIGITYKNETRLVFRHENDDYSYDMAATMDLSRIRFTDPDIKKFGDVIMFVLEGVSYGDNRERRFGGLGTDYSPAVPADPGYTPSGPGDPEPARDSHAAIDEVQYFSPARAWVGSSAANSLKDSKWDVTNIIRPLLARPFPVEGKDKDATRRFDGIVYTAGVDDDNYDDGRKLSIYQAHKDTWNNRGNLMGLTADGETVYPTNLSFWKVPKLSDFRTAATGLRPSGINGSEGLTFHYKAIDLGDNEVTFQVYVPTRANWAPQIDAYEWTDFMESGIDYEYEEEYPLEPTNGDVRGERFILPLHEPAPGVWATSQPAELEKNSWGFVWNQAGGVEPDKYYIADYPYSALTGSTTYGNGVYNALAAQASADPVYLMIPPGDSTDGSKNVDNYGGINNPVKTTTSTNSMHGTPNSFIFDWTPTKHQGRKSYAFTIYGWDKYGAGMRPFPMTGRVFGSLEGVPIYKWLYNDGAPLPAGPADLTIEGNARVSINPFFDNTFPEENRLANQYGMDADQPWLSINQQGSANPWHVSHVPPNTPMLVSAARSSAGDEAVIPAPVIGPAVLSADGSKVGDRFVSFDTTGGSTTLTAEQAAEFPTATWETGNRISYAYIDPMKAEDEGAKTDPDKRLKVDLTAYVGSGQLAVKTDKSLDLLGADGETVFNVTGLEAPETWAWANDSDQPLDYYGLMYGVGAAGITAEGVIQVVMPSVGQSAFFHIEDPGADPVFPSAAYPSRLGWFNTPLVAKNYKYSNLDQNFEPVVLPVFPDDGSLSGNSDVSYGDYIAFDAGSSALAQDKFPTGLPYKFHIGEGGTPNYTMVSLKRELNPMGGTYTPPSGGAAGNLNSLPVWTIQKTGVPTELKSKSLLNFDNVATYDSLGDPDTYRDKLQHESRWKDLTEEKFGTFNATVNRGAFSAYLNRLASTPTAVTRANVVDTLQVVSYVSGTKLGPVDNHQGLPVFLEFGDLNNYAASGGGIGLFDGTYNLGRFDIFKPEADQWHTEIGGEDNLGAPVVSYIARYEDSVTHLKGTMGLITDDLSSGVALAGFTPISAVRITGVPAGSSLPAAADPVEYLGNAATGTRRGTGVSVPIASYYSSGTTAAPAAAAPIIVKAYNDDGRENYKVWLTWTNPGTTAGLSNHDKYNISGNIIEFFDAAKCGDSDLPLYKVYVGPSISAFPIPDPWLPYLGFTSSGFNAIPGVPTNVVVRIRTVRYGDRAKGNFVNFDESPFKQALPAVWMDTLTTTLSFTNAGSEVIGLESESMWNRFKKTGQNFSGFAADGTYPIGIVAADNWEDAPAASTLAAIAANTIVFTNTDKGSNTPIDGTDVTWTAELIRVTPSVMDGSDLTFDPATLADFDDTTATLAYSGGNLTFTLDPTTWAAAEPAGTPDVDEDWATITFTYTLTATYTVNGNDRTATKTIYVPVTKNYGIWGGFEDDVELLLTTPPAFTPLNLTDPADETEVIGGATMALGTVVPTLPAGFTVGGGALTWAWTIDGNATVGGTATTTPGTLAGVGLVTDNSNAPTINIPNGALQTAVGTLPVASGSYTVTVTVPLKLELSFNSTAGGAITRTQTWSGNVVYTVNITIS